MSCELTPTLVADYLGADLSERLHTEYQAHLSECAHCRGELESLLPTREALGAWKPAVVPAWPHNAIATAARVADESVSRCASNSLKAKAKPGAGPALWFGAAPRWRMAGVFAVAAFVLTVATLIPRGPWQLEKRWGESSNGQVVQPRTVQTQPQASQFQPLLLTESQIRDRQHHVNAVAAVLGQSLQQVNPAVATRGRYLVGQGIVLEIWQTELMQGEVHRPVGDDVTQMYALSLDGEAAGSQTANARSDLAEWDSLSLLTLCRLPATDLSWLSGQEYVTLIFSRSTADPTGSSGGGRERFLSLSADALQACQQGQVGADDVHGNSLRYTY